MTKGSKKRLIERVKSLMILLLSCSAVLLVLRTQSVMLGRDSRGERYAAGESGPIASEDAGGAVRPLRMAGAIQRGSEVVRYGVQYDQESTDTLFQQSYSLLVEALSSAGQPQSVDEAAWQAALASAPLYPRAVRASAASFLTAFPPCETSSGFSCRVPTASSSLSGVITPQVQTYPCPADSSQ